MASSNWPHVEEIVRLNRPARNLVDPLHQRSTRPTTPAFLKPANRWLRATQALCQLRLGQLVIDPPSREVHDVNPSAKVIYCGTLYFRDGHKQVAGSKYKQMAYVYVMKPRNRIRELRKLRRISQAELAELAGVSQPAISQIENDTRPLSLDWMRLFARILQVAPADLMDEDDNPDRLSEQERQLIENFRAATAAQRAMVARAAEPLPEIDNDNHRKAG